MRFLIWSLKRSLRVDSPTVRVKTISDKTVADWISQLISSEITDDASLAQTFNDFLGGLTCHLKPLQHLSAMMGPVPEHIYVSDYKVYTTLCSLKTKKSPGPDEIPTMERIRL